MNLRIRRLDAVGLALLTALALVTFVYLMDRFGGPSVSLSTPYTVSARFADTQGLARKSDVLVRGVKVGEVSAIEVQGSRAKVTFKLSDRYAPLRRRATVRIGQKTLLGEAYVDVEPGDSRAPALRSGDEIARDRTIAAVELDEALAPLVGAGGRHMLSALRTFRRGARSPQASVRFNTTLAQLRRAVEEVRGVTDTLRGQQANIAAGVQDTRIIFRELGQREAAIRNIVSQGRATLDVISSRRPALEQTLVELPRLLETGRRTLAEAQPLVGEARPLLADLRTASPPLTAALRDVGPVAGDTEALLARLGGFNDTALPFLRRALPVVRLARPAARRLGPALANLVPVINYLEPRKNTLAAWFANTADMGLNRDAKGYYTRFFIFLENGTGFGNAGKFSNNAYTRPDDADANKPYKPGGYPRLRPFSPR